jgi:hypothetical protein
MVEEKSVNIEVYGEPDGVFGVLSEHNPDLPKFEEDLQE